MLALLLSDAVFHPLLLLGLAIIFYKLQRIYKRLESA